MVTRVSEQLNNQNNSASIRSMWGTIFYNAKVYDLVGDGSTNDYTDLYNLINTTINGAEATIIFPKGTYKISSNITIPSNVSLYFVKGAMLSPDSGKTITINGPVEAGLWKIFTGSGTIAGSVKVKGVFPQWWGAVGNGVTDDSAPIQAASNCASLSCKVVVFPNGTYIAKNISPKTGVRYLGANKNSVILLSNDIAVDVFKYTENSDYNVFENLTVTHNATTDSYSSGTYTGKGIYVPNGITANYGLVKNCFFTNIARQAIAPWGVNNGWIVTNNFFKNMGREAVFFISTVLSVITDNVIDNTGDDGIAITVNSHHNTVSNNTLTYIGNTGGLNGSGVKCHGDYNVISNNTVKWFRQAGVWVHEGDTNPRTPDYNIVEANTIYGILYDAAKEQAGLQLKGVLNVSLRNNIVNAIDNQGTPVYGMGVRIENGSNSKVEITDNTFLCDYIVNRRTSVKELIVRGNKYTAMKTNSRAIYIHDGSDAAAKMIIENNTFDGNSLGQSALYLFTNTISFDLIKFNNNTCYGFSSNDVNLQNKTVARITMLGNSFSSTTPLNNTSGVTSYEVDNDIGRKWRNDGTSSITSGNTSVVVSHGLDRAPSFIEIMPTSTYGSATFWYITNITTTQFTLNLNANPAATFSFTWRAFYEILV